MLVRCDATVLSLFCTNAKVIIVFSLSRKKKDTHSTSISDLLDSVHFVNAQSFGVIFQEFFGHFDSLFADLFQIIRRPYLA